ncbi:MAG TPA: PQQ-binding-like beta-propeller repeat protein [Aromatoleum sp.]|uniref:outer membrane protein assembly factor BamB family protein n=1 Tax=Aromatoleum sp. TaxID=2307007 RepID=UPI002B47ECD7|nr:PQQ-binding-like beta-propeller repeat protein [Aromatoleum sp.]HJV25612.1 PQQ-binding-like beta-propeller repeat protein [Aromatoleum sp.]
MQGYFDAQSLIKACRSGRAMATATAVLMLVAGMIPPADAAITEPVLQWTAGGLSAGIDSAGQAARMAVDARGNVAIVSGPSQGRDLAVTSYTENGVFRWRNTVSPASGTFVGDWVVAAPNGDFLAVGHNINSSGNPIQTTLLRFDMNGALLWRVEPAVGFLPTVGRLVVDADGNAYLALSGRGSGMFVQKYDPSGTLLWSQRDLTGSGYALASSLALSPDGGDVVVTGGISGGASWNTIAYDAATGVRKWQVTAAEGTTAKDVVVDATRVYVTGQGATGAGTPALKYFLTVVAYERATGKRLWRTDRKPADGNDAFGLRMTMAPDGSLAVTGQTNRGFLDWYTVALETTGTVRWEAVRDGKLNTDEIPRAVLVMPDGTTVVTGRGGPNLAGGYIPGVTAGYSSSGQLLWVAFSTLETIWAAALPNGDVCATGGYDALVTCWSVPANVVTPPPDIVPLPTAPASLVASSTTRRRIDLVWRNTASDASSIMVERCAGSACTAFAPVAQLAATATSWSDSQVKSKSTYSYRLRATNTAGSSEYSNTASATAR